MQRERRANAGSKMKQLIEEQLASGKIMMEDENDDEFGNDAANFDEMDDVDSDFQSTDEEEAGRDYEVDIPDYEDDVSRKRKRDKLLLPMLGSSKRAAAAPSTIAVTTGQAAYTKQHRSKQRKEHDDRHSLSTRRSHRAATVQNKERLEKRIMERKQAVVVKKPKVPEAKLTQAELLAEAIEVTEPANILYLEEMQALEQERERLKSLRSEKVRIPPGPTVTFLSVRSDKRIRLADSQAEDETSQTIKHGNGDILPQMGSSGNLETLDMNAVSGIDTKTQVTPLESGVKGQPGKTPRIENEADAAVHTILPGRTAAAAVEEHVVTRNFLVFENHARDPFERFHKSPESRGGFGGRRRSICPITGLPAKYRDPLSGVPYANKEAFANSGSSGYPQQQQQRWDEEVGRGQPLRNEDYYQQQPRYPPPRGVSSRTVQNPILLQPANDLQVFLQQKDAITDLVNNIYSNNEQIRSLNQRSLGEVNQSAAA
ncbi:hypothetical protein HDU76_013841, partial [Blyttiomyces sp. JEL0837]